MLIIPVKEGDSVEKALKVYKKKFEKTQLLKLLRKRQHFTKPSINRRQQILHAIFRQKVQEDMSL